MGVIRLGQQRDKPFALKILEPTTKFISKTIGSPKLTPFLAGGLGLLTGGPLVGGKAFLGTGLAVGVAQQSPLVRKQIGETIKDPTRTGRFVGEQVEKIAKPPLEEDKTLKERVKEGLTAAGVIGGAAALGTAGVIAATKKIKEVKPKIPTTIQQPPVATTMQQQPISAIPKETPKEKEVAVVQPQRLPTIKNTFKPEINISFRKSRRFINQQVLIR